MVRILVIDDDVDIRKMLRRSLGADGYVVDAVVDAAAGLAHLQRMPVDVIILDLNLPDQDGLAVCQSLRRSQDDTPILMLTARDTAADRIAGLRAGADDYLAKPFEHEELILRIDALHRRADWASGNRSRFGFGPVLLNSEQRTVYVDGAPVELTAREFDLLEVFMRHPNIVIHKDRLLERVWGNEYETHANSLAVYVGYLRRKLAEHNAGDMIQTVRGVGYVLRSSTSAEVVQ